MTGGALIVTRKTSRHQDFIDEFSALGFLNITITSLDKDALYFLIDELKPSLILMDAMFYSAGTPYMIRVMLKQKRFKNLNIAIFAVDEYPADLGMMFIANGAKSYIDINDGKKQFYEGLVNVLNGKSFISASVEKRRNLCDEIPEHARIITERQKIVLMLICCGFEHKEIAVFLCISTRTVDNEKAEINRSLGSTKPHELIIIAIKMGLFTLNDLVFIGKKYNFKPNEEREKITEKQTKKKKAA